MIIFKNNAADVQWSLNQNAIICHWKDNPSFDEIKEVVLAVTELQEANELAHYISDRSNLSFLWSGYIEWYAFHLYQIQLSSLFSNVIVLDPAKKQNAVLLKNHEQIGNNYSIEHQVKFFDSPNVLNQFIEQDNVKTA
ncbi:hypothetical protein KMW28_13485 [Flammeovirga yaeyamensis]|uniref:Uncharacterized protein n=1 Tax=Flammeovirga yaeyamensis TaxID=367791 RepID=A0AAX1N487_9BACT|nr:MULTISPECIES: hypothetical protein [Flammeovirga]ANQ47932.1 hypothetical protein MY04_0550 [Flammeovirga sp. MY04]MBB3700905.1 hypothetical protein [Flammeovirga yaeyamensis]NMF38013.1 hypothetical protein [Flammeovirga yaeyamensis]QWG00663.1 hypothetical protein KMW28_13485 [Flammeovirga yaeyamensis]